MQDTRYFIITYLFGNGVLGTGTLGYTGTDYPNINKLMQQSKVDNFNIITIIEVSHKDYTDFWK